MTSPLRFDGEVAVVTGAGRGIGLAHARALAARGAAVVVNDVDPDVAHDATSAIVADGGEAAADSHDISVESGARALVEHAVDAFGRIDVLVNNAGIANQAAITDLDAATVERVLAVNSVGSLNMARAVWPRFAEQLGGRILNTSSPSILGSPIGIAYQTSKFAVLGFTRSLALAGADLQIRTNCVLPMAYSRMVTEHASESMQAMFEAHFPASSVASVAVALLHRACRATGESFLVGGAKVSRVALALDDGFTAHGADAEPEALVEQLEQMERRPADLWVPHDQGEQWRRWLTDLDLRPT